MDTLNELIDMFIVLIGIGSVTRASISLIRGMLVPEEKQMYNKVVKNSIIATIIASSVFVIKAVVEHYFL